jgi:hypothetical protein
VIIWPPSRWRFLPIPSTFNQPGVDSGKGSAAVASAAPYLPLAAGFAGAFPLTLVQRRVRRRAQGRMRSGARNRVPDTTRPGKRRARTLRPPGLSPRVPTMRAGPLRRRSRRG